MKISTKGRYALRMMIEIGMNPEHCTKISQIAARQGISDKYLEQIATLLVRAGFIRSIRGAQGGYILTKKPEQYTVGMILRQTEGSLSPVTCLDEEINSCERASKCACLTLWTQLKNAIDQVVDQVTLADLITEQKQKPDMNLL
ncbi:MAG: RrF2 family transcriptional regulator [Brotaphodocola sp.]